MSSNPSADMKEKIDKMDKQQHIEVLKIIQKYCSHDTLKKNENKNGIYINMTCLSKECLDEIQTFVDYVGVQETTLNDIEKEKKELIKTYYPDNKI
jgi:hypothetical protein